MRAEEIKRNLIFLLLFMLLIIVFSMFLFAIFGDNDVYDYIIDSKLGRKINDLIIEIWQNARSKNL